MNVVKIRVHTNQHDVKQYTVTVPYAIKQHFPEATRMLMEYNKLTGKVIGTPLLEDEIIPDEDLP